MVEPLPLVRDVLDKQVFDANRLKVGKVDGIVLVPRNHRPPRVDALELHMPTAWRRVSARLAAWLEALQRWIDPDRAQATRIRFERVVSAGVDVTVDIDARRTNAYAWENWLDQMLIQRIPGGKASGGKE